MLAIRNAFFLLAASVVMLSSATLVPAQDSATGSIRGTVFDSSGARVPQASVTVVNSGTGAGYSLASDSEGHFVLELLPPGDYSARVEAQGMSPQETPQLHVDVGGTAELMYHLKVAGAEESLTVSGAQAIVETKPAAVSMLLDERAVNDFPLNGRRFSDLTLFSPGVTQDPRGLTSSTNGDLSFGGIRGFQNTFLVDGSDYNNAFFAQARGRYRAPYQFSTEVVQEFRVSSNSYGAEQGRSGGAVVNVVTKSGTNHLHGTGFYYLRDSSFGATLPFLAFKPHNRQQQFGGTIGGPLKRNKIFFFCRIRSAHFSCGQCRGVSGRQFKGRSPTRHGPLHSWRLRSHRSISGFRRGCPAHITCGRVSGRSSWQLRVWQTRYQPQPTKPTRTTGEYHALLGIQQRVS
jgi:hypothetical protein